MEKLVVLLYECVVFVCEVSFVGWSLGGFYVCEFVKYWYDWVYYVIIIGIFFNGSVDDINVGWLFCLFNGCWLFDEVVLCECLVELLLVLMILFYSWCDGVVLWEVCWYGCFWLLVCDIEV